jgi:hypothetical protein
VTIKTQDVRELSELAAGVLLLSGWLTLVGAAFSTSIYLLIPTGIGYGLLSHANAIREQRVLRLMAVSLAVVSLVLWFFMLWVSTHQTVSIVN